MVNRYWIGLFLVLILLIQPISVDNPNQTLSVNNYSFSEDVSNQTNDSDSSLNNSQDSNSTQANESVQGVNVTVDCYRNKYSVTSYYNPPGFCEITNHGNETYTFNGSLIEVHPLVHNLSGINPNPIFVETILEPMEVVTIDLVGDYVMASAITYALELNFNFTIVDRNDSSFDITTYFYWVVGFCDCEPTNYSYDANNSSFEFKQFTCQLAPIEYFSYYNSTVRVNMSEHFIEDDFMFDLDEPYEFTVNLTNTSNYTEDAFVKFSFRYQYNGSNYSLGKIKINPMEVVKSSEQYTPTNISVPGCDDADEAGSALLWLACLFQSEDNNANETNQSEVDSYDYDDQDRNEVPGFLFISSIGTILVAAMFVQRLRTKTSDSHD